MRSRVGNGKDGEMKTRTFTSECYAGSVWRELIENNISVTPLRWSDKGDDTGEFWYFDMKVEK